MYLPEIGSKWLHASGKISTVVLINNSHTPDPAHPVSVSYTDQNGHTGCECLTDFLKRRVLFESPQETD